MKFGKTSGIVLISLLTLISILITSCAANPATVTVTTTSTSTTTTTATTTPAAASTSTPASGSTSTVTVTPPPVTITVTAAPGTTVPPNPVTISGTDMPMTAQFFIGKEITSYIKSTPRLDGSYDQTPVYSDKFFPLKEIMRFGPSNATFVPRIPTITNHDDWFIRFSVPTSMMKPWMINYGYTVKPGDTTTSVEFSLFPQGDFDKFYYNRPNELAAADIDSGDRGTSLDGTVQARFMQDKWGDFIIFWRTNNAPNVTGWWVRIGVEE